MNKDKITGSLIGLAVGDALGVPYEFRTPPLIFRTRSTQVSFTCSTKCAKSQNCKIP